MRKHPLFFGFLLLISVGVVCMLVMYALGLLNGGGTPLTARKYIGVVKVEGVIRDSRKIIDLIADYEEDDDIKAVVLRIDSPGGAVVPAQEIYDRVRALAVTKPVVASMGTVAASGGYYVASAADLIIANPGTITGSIGVIVQFSHIHDLLEKIGLETTVVKSGEYKDIGSPLREMEPRERKIFQELVNDIYDQFVTAVSESRSLPKSEVVRLADGRIYTGRQAQEAGLVDELGGIDHAVDRAAQMAGIIGEPHVVYPEKEKKSLIRYIIGEIHHEIVYEMDRTQTGILYRMK